VALALAERYRIERELGHGGMATVYLARDLKHERHVAIKVLRPELAAVLGPERFLREIKLTAQLNHPHILPLLDSGNAGGFLFYAMPYVEGESLRDRLNREGRLPVEDALQVAREVADALDYAHRHDVLHRDIKPENILLEEQHAVVADFGIARAIDAAGGETLTATGMAIGTPMYMSPEQVSGERQLDGRSDLYALGCVLYEMLAGQPPFAGTTAQAMMMSRLVQRPPPPRRFRKDLPAEVEETLQRALDPEPGRRFPSVQEFAAALPGPRAPSRLTLRATAIAVVAALLLGAGWLGYRVYTARAADTALVSVERLIERGDYQAAFAVAERVARMAPRNPLLLELWPRMSAQVSITSTPPGAEVVSRPYAQTDAPWHRLGISPIAGRRIPLGVYRLRFAMPGYDTLEVLWGTPKVTREIASGIASSAPTFQNDSALVVWLPSRDSAAGMVLVSVNSLVISRGYAADLLEIPAAPFWIDRYEVTNEAYQRFVDQGGYTHSEYWPHRIILGGQAVSWDQAMRTFRDQTGRPGPATWEGGTYPVGEARYPVRGVSWYEAAAYARFLGKELPTVYHWSTASRAYFDWAPAASLSNLQSTGPAPVGQFLGVTRFGAFDLFGNVKEWSGTATDASRGQYYLLGQSWLDPYGIFDVRPPWDRSADNGVRLIRSAGMPTPVQALAPTAMWAHGRASLPDSVYRTATPAEFALYRDHLYAHDPSPLADSVVEVDDSSRLWRRETVTFAAPYGGERIRAYLFLPKGKDIVPPYQAVVYVPTDIAFFLSDSRSLGQGQAFHDYFWDFIAMSGRAVLFPILKGTYERAAPRSAHFVDPMTFAMQDVQDVLRAMDYLFTRGDIDTMRLAYYGASRGAYLGPIVAALEPRFRTTIWLLHPCLYADFMHPSAPVSPMRYLPWVRMPVLSISGANDYVTSNGPACLQRQFQLLGTPPDQRRNVLYPGGHGMYGAFAHQARGEILAWLDRYLGPVATGSPP
jgi:formylglycine-generating enzyme required for sulfatase activity